MLLKAPSYSRSERILLIGKLVDEITSIAPKREIRLVVVEVGLGAPEACAIAVLLVKALTAVPPSRRGGECM